MMLGAYADKFVFIAVGFLSELAMMAQYMKFFSENEFYGLKHLLLGPLFMPSLIGLVIKNSINMIELKQGMYRIVDFDVEEKNAAIKKQKAN